MSFYGHGFARRLQQVDDERRVTERTLFAIGRRDDHAARAVPRRRRLRRQLLRVLRGRRLRLAPVGARPRGPPRARQQGLPPPPRHDRALRLRARALPARAQRPRDAVQELRRGEPRQRPAPDAAAGPHARVRGQGGRPPGLPDHGRLRAAGRRARRRSPRTPRRTSRRCATSAWISSACARSARRSSAAARQPDSAILKLFRQTFRSNVNGAQYLDVFAQGPQGVRPARPSWPGRPRC